MGTNRIDNAPSWLTGITIGPIYKTILAAETTKGVWASSFIFSELSFQIARAIQSFALTEDGKNHLVELWSPAGTLPEQQDGYGIYPDRIFFISTLTPADVNELFTVPAIQSLALSLNDTDGSILVFLSQYLEINIVQNRNTDVFSPEHILSLSDQLSLFEYRPTTSTDLNYKRFHTLINGIDNNTPLYNTQFGSVRHFVSVEEIAKNTGANENKLCSHYFAVVLCDGDDLGKAIEKINSVESYQSFQSGMNTFVERAGQLVQEFGGQMVYAGGDDLFFFAPVLGKLKGDDLNQNSSDPHLSPLIALVAQLQQDFSSCMSTAIPGLEATLSFGIHIQYYKAPLYEGILKARSNLNQLSKQNQFILEASEDHKTKNTLTVSYQPHGSPVSLASLPLPMDFFSKANIFLCGICLNPESYPARILKRYDAMAEYLQIIISDPYGEPSCKAFLENLIRSREESIEEDIRDNLILLIDSIFKPGQRWYAKDTLASELEERIEANQVAALQFILRFAGFITKSIKSDE